MVLPRLPLWGWGAVAAGAVALLGIFFYSRKTADGGGISTDLPVDPYAAWDTSKDGDCDPVAKPGVLAFRKWALSKWGEKAGSPQNIVRACDVGKASEHHEGRAWDLMTRDLEHGQAIADALTAPDPRTGEPDALARRAGIMYMIWKRQMWRAYPWQGAPSGTWSDYTAGEAASPHVDHLHFSFSRDGAAGKTSLYQVIGSGEGEGNA